MKTKDTIQCINGEIKTIIYPDDYDYKYNKCWKLIKREYVA